MPGFCFYIPSPVSLAMLLFFAGFHQTVPEALPSCSGLNWEVISVLWKTVEGTDGRKYGFVAKEGTYEELAHLGTKVRVITLKMLWMNKKKDNFWNL